MTKHVKLHKSGFFQKNDKTKRIARLLDENMIKYDHELCVVFCGESTTKFAKIDFVNYAKWGHLVLECDENMHAHYAVSCVPVK